MLTRTINPGPRSSWRGPYFPRNEFLNLLVAIIQYLVNIYKELQLLKNHSAVASSLPVCQPRGANYIYFALYPSRCWEKSLLHHGTFSRFCWMSRKNRQSYCRFNLQNIGLKDCRGQGFDNGSYMSGKYEGAQNHIQRKNKYAVLSPCGVHLLNFAGVESAECCLRAITFSDVVQKCFNISSSNTQRCEILKSKIPYSLLFF